MRSNELNLWQSLEGPVLELSTRFVSQVIMSDYRCCFIELYLCLVDHKFGWKKKHRKKLSITGTPTRYVTKIPTSVAEIVWHWERLCCCCCFRTKTISQHSSTFSLWLWRANVVRVQCISSWVVCYFLCIVPFIRVQTVCYVFPNELPTPCVCALLTGHVCLSSPCLLTWLLVPRPAILLCFRLVPSNQFRLSLLKVAGSIVCCVEDCVLFYCDQDLVIVDRIGIFTVCVVLCVCPCLPLSILHISSLHVFHLLLTTHTRLRAPRDLYDLRGLDPTVIQSFDFPLLFTQVHRIAQVSRTTAQVTRYTLRLVIITKRVAVLRHSTSLVVEDHPTGYLDLHVQATLIHDFRAVQFQLVSFAVFPWHTAVAHVASQS